MTDYVWEWETGGEEWKGVKMDEAHERSEAKGESDKADEHEKEGEKKRKITEMRKIHLQERKKKVW